MNETYDFLFKVVVVGDSGVGKTGITNRYLKGNFQEDMKTTVGVEFGAKKVVIKEKCVKIQIWDTAGQERYRSVTTAYYKGAKGALIVYDITNSQSFQNIERWIKEVRDATDKEIKIILIGNKSDLEENRKVSAAEGQKLSDENNLSFFETSGKENLNVDTAFDNISNSVVSSMIEKAKFEVKDEFLFSSQFKSMNLDEDGNNKRSSDKKKECC